MGIRKQRNKIIGNVIFYIVVVIVLGIIIFNLNDINDIIKDAISVKLSFLFIAIGFLVLHMFLTNLSMYVIQRKLENSLSFFISMNVSNTEYLFNAITPFSSGGQPIQAYYLMKHGMTGEESASALVANFTIYQFVLTIFSTIGLIIYYSKISQTIDQYAIVIFIGYFINTIILVGLILIGTVDSFKKLLRGFFRLLGKIKFLSKPMEKLEKKTFVFIENFQVGTKYLLTNKGVLLKSTMLRVLDLIVLNSIPIFIFLALNIDVTPSDYIFIIMMTSFASTFMMWIPTPGGLGGVEWAFTTVFTGLIATGSVITTAMLLWRLITYFLALVLGFVSYIIVRRKGRLT